MAARCATAIVSYKTALALFVINLVLTAAAALLAVTAGVWHGCHQE
jgi:hypothetical protein